MEGACKGRYVQDFLCFDGQMERENPAMDNSCNFRFYSDPMASFWMSGKRHNISRLDYCAMSVGT